MTYCFMLPIAGIAIQNIIQSATMPFAGFDG
jgi:hypothetical protein